ncbi:TnsA endonuclease N-terminal domain-containing protein [Kordiimonas sp.]|uniref:TnsA endonuclease N-terminal domain-containing protein n=1 Tax=Kordiimonas sp. TaxID=1970157 RepID=UPI003A8D3C7F
MPVTTTKLISNSKGIARGTFDSPVRNVVRRNPCRVVGFHASRKMGKLIGFESQIELMYFEWLEVDPDVLKFYAQPVTIQFKDSRYTPDVLVVSRTAEYFVEIKPDSVFKDGKTIDRIKGLQRHFLQCGSELKLITKSDLTRQPLRNNVEHLGRITRRGASQSVAELVLKHCLQGAQTIDELRSRMSDSAESWLVLDAVVLGYVRLDFTQPIDGNSVVTPADWM